jgi:branched-subunit amino acid ABC-type transport system permease component
LAWAFGFWSSCSTAWPGFVAVPGGGGLSLIFGVTRIVNFAHGSFYMLGIYVAYSLVGALGTGWASGPRCCWRRWPGRVLGALVEMLLLRRIYRRPSCSSCWPPSPWCW